MRWMRHQCADRDTNAASPQVARACGSANPVTTEATTQHQAAEPTRIMRSGWARNHSPASHHQPFSRERTRASTPATRAPVPAAHAHGPTISDAAWLMSAVATTAEATTQGWYCSRSRARSAVASTARNRAAKPWPVLVVHSGSAGAAASRAWARVRSKSARSAFSIWVSMVFLVFFVVAVLAIGTFLSGALAGHRRPATVGSRAFSTLESSVTGRNG